MIGCNAPMVLRPGTDGDYMIIGEAIVDGMLERELLFGPLPKKYTRVPKYDDASGDHFDTYLDLDTEATLLEDPRLGPLPEGWCIRRHARQNAWNWYVKDDKELEYDETEVQKLKITDPRMIAEELRKRDVTLQRIRLI